MRRTARSDEAAAMPPSSWGQLQRAKGLILDIRRRVFTSFMFFRWTVPALALLPLLLLSIPPKAIQMVLESGVTAMPI